MAASAEAVRIAVITGGNKGIGWHIADQLIKAGGFRVLIACRNPELGAKAAAELGAEYTELDVGSEESIAAFAERMSSEHGRVDVFVNNAGIASNSFNSTPFEEQTGPILKVNYWGTARLTDAMLPLLRNGRSPRLVNVASMKGKLKEQLSAALQEQFSSPGLTREVLDDLVRKFEADVAAGQHQKEGWGNSNYGFSKLALIAYTKIAAREEADTMRVNACCPGWCSTDMGSQSGPRSASDGARNAVQCVFLPDDGPTGEFWENEGISVW